MSWELIVSIAVFVIGLILAGYVKKIKKELAEVIAALVVLTHAFQKAVADNTITDEERKDLIAKFEQARQECRDVAELAKEVALAWLNRGKSA